MVRSEDRNSLTEVSLEEQRTAVWRLLSESIKVRRVDFVGCNPVYLVTYFFFVIFHLVSVPEHQRDSHLGDRLCVPDSESAAFFYIYL